MSATRMALRQIGATDLYVTPLGLGCGSFSGYLQSVSHADAVATVRRAREHAIGYFDTAPFYGYGRSEHVVGDALRDEVGWVLSSKVGRLLGSPRRLGLAAPHWLDPFPFHPVFDYSYDGAMRSFEDSLQRLATDRIDVVFIHDIDRVNHGDDQPARFREAMEGAYRALDTLRSEGAVRAIGIGVNETQVCIDALKYGQWDCMLLAGRHTLLEREAASTLFPLAVAAHT